MIYLRQAKVNLFRDRNRSSSLQRLPPVSQTVLLVGNRGVRPGLDSAGTESLSPNAV